MDRRKFIESAGRWGIIGVFAVIISILVRRNAITLSNEKDLKFCSKCSKRSTCTTQPNSSTCHPEQAQEIESSTCHPDEGQDLTENVG